MKTPVETILLVAAIGGRLGVSGEQLRTLLPADCSPELKNALRKHKPDLLKLLRLNFSIVQSDALRSVVFWASDEATKDTLVEAGAVPSSIYTFAELNMLARRPIRPEELPLIHGAKVRFGGRIVQP